MQQNYRFNIDGWLLIWKVRNALFCETSNMTFHEGSLKNNFGPWKKISIFCANPGVLESVFNSFWLSNTEYNS